VEGEGQDKSPESEVNNMYRSYTDSGGAPADTANEEIRLLHAISRVSARLARNLTILAADSKSKEGGKTKCQHASEMEQTIKEIRDAAAAINAAADRLARQAAGDDNAEEHQDRCRNRQKKPKLSLADVRAVLADKSRAGYTEEIRELLHKYGAEQTVGRRPEGLRGPAV
jgi:phage host-nuclease inhibitor protein Gam